MMHVALFIVYALLLSILVSRSSFLRSSQLPSSFLITIFLLYALAGCVHVWIAFHYFPNHGDVWEAYRIGTTQKHLLLTDFAAFKADFFPGSFDNNFTSTLSGWSHFEPQMIFSLHILFNFFSFNNIYINTLLFCFVTMWGKLALFKVFTAVNGGEKLVPVILVFFIPSVIFWTSPLHKEGILFSAIGLLLYCLMKLMRAEHTSGKWILLCFSLLIVLLTRKLILVTLLPGAALWYLCEKTRLKKPTILLSVTGLTILIFILLSYIHPSLNLLHQITLRQHDFLQLEGASRIALPRLIDDTYGFAKVLPYALLNGYLMPLPGTGGKLIYSIFSIELIIIWLLILYSIYYGIRQNNFRLSGFSLFCLFFSLTALLIIGYIVPFAGAIVRYRSLFCPFLLFPFFVLLQKHPFVVRLGSRLISRPH